MPCRVCQKALPAAAGTWPFSAWVEGRLLPAESAVCEGHAVRRACERCLEPMSGLEAACAGSAGSRGVVGEVGSRQGVQLDLACRNQRIDRSWKRGWGRRGDGRRQLRDDSTRT